MTGLRSKHLRPRAAGALIALLFTGFAWAESPDVDPAGRPCSRGTESPDRHRCLPSPVFPSAVGLAAALFPTQVCTARFEEVRPPRSPSAPRDEFLCPVARQFRTLDARYPATGLFVNYLPREPGVFPGNAGFIRDLVAQVRSASPQTQVNVLVARASLSRAQADLAATGSDPRVRLIPTDAGVSLWAQDTHEFGVVDGKPAILDLPTDPSRGDAIPRAIADACTGSRMTYLPEPCRDPSTDAHAVSAPDGACLDLLIALEFLPLGSPKRPAVEERLARDYPTCAEARSVSCCPRIVPATDDDWGGNVEAIPGGVLVGRGVSPGIRDFLRAQQRPDQPVVEVRSEFLAVGHADEIFNVVATDRPSPCNFALLVNSPAEGLRVLRRRARGYGGERVGDAIVEPSGPKRVRDWLADRDFVAKNELIDRMIQQDKLRMLAGLREGSGCANVPSVAVPGLFTKGAWRRSAIRGLNLSLAADRERAFGTLSANGGDSESVLPNMVNSIGLGSTSIVPEPHYGPFQRAVEERLRAAGVTPSFLDDRYYHNGMGELHCATNVVRGCSELLESPFD